MSRSRDKKKQSDITFDNLCAQIRLGNILEINNLLTQNIDLLNQDKQGLSALHFAVQYGNPEIIQLLIDKKPALLNQQATQGSTPLHFAVQYRNIDVVKLLLKNNATLGIRAGSHGNTELHLAAALNQSAIAKELLQTNPDLANLINDNGKTPLQLAQDKNHAGVVNVFNAFSPNQQSAHSDALSFTEALKAGDFVSIVKILDSNPLAMEAMDMAIRTKKINVSVKNPDGMTLLHIAAQEGCTHTIGVLLSLINENTLKQVNNQGETALHLAAKRGSFEIAQQLIRRNAELDPMGHADMIDAITNDGKTALDLAKENDRIGYVEQFKRRGSISAYRSVERPSVLSSSVPTSKPAQTTTTTTLRNTDQNNTMRKSKR